MTAHEARCEWFESIAGRSLPSVALAAYTSFRIGGRADVLFFPRDLAALREACELCRERDVPLFVLGAGTNLLSPELVTCAMAKDIFGIGDEQQHHTANYHQQVAQEQRKRSTGLLRND